MVRTRYRYRMVPYKTPAGACVYFSLDAAHTSGHGWPASTTLLKKNSESQPWTLDGRAPPAHHPSIAHCPVDGVLKEYRRGGGGVASPGPSPLPLRQDAYSTRRLQEPPLRAPRDVVILHYFFEPTRARRAPAAAGPGTHPKKETGDGTFATPARTRPKREAARGGRGAEKVGRAVGCGPPPPGPGRVRTAELAIARAPATDAGSARRGPTMAGPVSAVDARGIVGPPDARAARESDAAPNLWRAASRGAGRCDRAADALGRPSHGASRALAGLGALTGPKR